MFIHNQNYLHRDLKPANILITCNNKIKIIDFGLCVQLKSTSGKRQKLCRKIGTKTYMSPEQRSSRYYGYEAEIYTLGLILIEMLRFFKTTTIRNKAFAFINEKRVVEKLVPNQPEIVNLILSMTSFIPKNRPTLEDALKVIEREIEKPQND